MMDSMDMCFHKLSSEGKNHFKQCLKHCVVSCKETISNETPYLMERVWLTMGMFIDRQTSYLMERVWLTMESLSTEHGETMAGYGKLINRAWRGFSII